MKSQYFDRSLMRSAFRVCDTRIRSYDLHFFLLHRIKNDGFDFYNQSYEDKHGGVNRFKIVLPYILRAKLAKHTYNGAS